MRNFAKRILSYFIIAIMLISIATAVPIETMAVSFPTTHPNTHKNTGNYAVDIVAIARTQVGYQENSAGTKYGDWYNGYFDTQPWCAMFVSWCANQANIPDNIIKKFAGCSTSVKWFKEQGIWQDSKYYGGNYTPKMGDIVFYRNSGSSNISDHVGILAGLNGNYLDVIEGNATNGACCEYTTSKSRSLDNAYVIGYGTPRYGNNNSSEPMENEPNDKEVWQVTDADTLSLRKSTSTSSERLALIPRGTILNVTKFKVTNDYLWGYTKYSGKKGWCALDYCMYLYGNINGEYYQLEPEITSTDVQIYVKETTKLNSKNTLGGKYSSSDDSIATVNEKGEVQGVANGTATITCETKTGVATCEIKVINPTIEKTKLTTVIEDTCTIKVVGAKETVKFKSMDKSIATVDKNGVVTGVSEGKVEVKAIVSGITLKCTVTVNKEPTNLQRYKVNTENLKFYDNYQGNSLEIIPIETLLKVTEVKYSNKFTWGKTQYKGKTGWVILNHCQYFDGSFNGTIYKVSPYINETTEYLCVGESYKLNVYDNLGTITFKSNNKKVATVDEEGNISCVAEGKATIKAKVDEKTLKCKVVIEKNPTKYQRFKVKRKKIYLKDGYKGKSIAPISKDTLLKISEVKYAKTLTWGKTRYNDTDGWVILNNCKYYDGTIGGKVYDVVPYMKVTSGEIFIGETFQTEIVDAKGKIVYSSNKKEIATVDKNGMITGVSAGKANIKIKNGESTLIFKIVVKNPILSDTQLHLIKGSKSTLTVEGGDMIKWKSSDSKVAKVTQKGVVKGLKYGEATIIVTVKGIELQCKVKVYEPKITKAKLVLKEKAKEKLKIKGNYSSDIKWQSRNTSIATVAKNGMVKAVKKGKTKITAAVDGKTLLCDVVVKS